ncbi:uncharacterized protein LOC131821052 [Mustela lutreola]|uniref:uncharacterized protein LOC131821052 n=1 Tax=Mustela lutreola TaxID=9666 RepID=UPI002796F878|nr:uncharacterized protein LOC131821052 [Mustela lutreola]
MHWLHKHVKYIESFSTAVWYEAVYASEVCSELLGGMCSSCSERAEPGRAAAAGPPAPHTGGLPALPRSAGPAGRGGLRRRKPVQAVPTALGEPARIARGALRGPEGRVLEEGRPEPQSGKANSALRPGPSLEGNGSPFVSRRRTHQPAHRPEEPRVHGRASNRHPPLSLKLTAPASPRVCLTTTWSPGLASLSLGLVPSITACTRPWMQVIQSSRKDCTQGSVPSVEPNAGPELMTLRPRPERRSRFRSSNQLSHPGAPNLEHLLCHKITNYLTLVL